MSIVFPSSPSTNDTFTVNNVTYVYDGVKWVITPVTAQKVSMPNWSIEQVESNLVIRYNSRLAAMIQPEGTIIGRIDIQSGLNPLLVDYPGALVAYSLHNLTSDDTVNVVRVRRDSDNAELDFTSEDLFVSGDLTTWLNGANAFVVTMYDQSGNDRHATQATAANQPPLLKDSNGLWYVGTVGNDDFLVATGYSAPSSHYEFYSLPSVGGAILKFTGSSGDYNIIRPFETVAVYPDSITNLVEDLVLERFVFGSEYYANGTITNLDYHFANETALTSNWNLNFLDTSGVTSFVGTWLGCTSFTDFPVGLFDIDASETFQSAWAGCSSLADFPSGFFDDWSGTPNNNCFLSAWSGCSSLTATSVENILVSIDESGVNGPASGNDIDIDYDIGTGALSAATTTAIANLVGKGWLININLTVEDRNDEYIQDRNDSFVAARV